MLFTELQQILHREARFQTFEASWRLTEAAEAIETLHMDSIQLHLSKVLWILMDFSSVVSDPLCEGRIQC